MSDPYGLGLGGGQQQMTPQMIQQLLMLLLQSGQQLPGMGQQFPDSAGAQQISFGFDPTQMQAMSMPMIPGSSDESDQGYIEEAAKQANYMQDVSNMAQDPFYAAMTGAGGFAADAFAPTVTNELIPTPATAQFQRYLDPANAGSFEGRIAQEIDGGGTISSAIAKMRQVIERADANPDNQQYAADADALRPYLAPLTPYYDNRTGETVGGGVDWQEVTRQAQDFVQPYLDEQAKFQPGSQLGSVYDPTTGTSSPGGDIVEIDGQLYRQTTEESPLAQAFHEAGIPLPTEQYTVGDMLGADWQRAADDYSTALPELRSSYETMQDDIDRANSLITGLQQAPLQEFYDRGSVPSLGEGGGTIPALTQRNDQPANDDLVHPAPAAASASDQVVNDALDIADPDALIAFVNSHRELSAEQLATIDRHVSDQEMVARQQGDLNAEQRWATVHGTVGHRTSDVTPPDAVSQEAMTLAQRAGAVGQQQQILSQLPLFRDNGMLGKDIMDVPVNDPRAYAEWLMTNWSSLSEDQRRDATTVIDINAGSAGQNLGTLSDPESVRMRGMWQSLRDQMNQLQSGTNVAEWNADQQGGAQGFMGPGGPQQVGSGTEALISQMADQMTGGGGKGDPWWLGAGQPQANTAPNNAAMTAGIPDSVANPANSPKEWKAAPLLGWLLGDYRPGGGGGAGGGGMRAMTRGMPRNVKPMEGDGQPWDPSQESWLEYMARQGQQAPAPQPGSNPDPNFPVMTAGPTDNPQEALNAALREGVIGVNGQQVDTNAMWQQVAYGDPHSATADYYLNRLSEATGITPAQLRQLADKVNTPYQPGNDFNVTDLRIGGGGGITAPPRDTLPVSEAAMNAGNTYTPGLLQTLQAHYAQQHPYNVTDLQLGGGGGVTAPPHNTIPMDHQTLLQILGQTPTPGGYNVTDLRIGGGGGITAPPAGPPPPTTIYAPNDANTLAQAPRTSNASTRTGPEPSEQATRPRGLELLWPGGRRQQTPDQASTTEMLRMLFGQNGGQRGAPEPKGPNRRDVAIWTQTERRNKLEDKARQTRFEQNMAYRNVYGRDYYRARGYARALQQMGITPTSVALANRTGGLGAMMGR